MNVAGRILHFGLTRRTAPALVEGDRTITFGALSELVRRTGSHLAALGVRRGDRVGLCLKDTADHIAIFLAVALIGGIAVPLDWRARPAENSPFVTGLKLARVIVEPDAQPLAGCAATVLDDAWRRSVALAGTDCAISSDWNDPFAISATSGSTGVPKFTLMTHAQYYFAISGMLELMGLAGRHRFLCSLPLYYSGGRNSALAHLLRGDCVVLFPSLFRPAEYVEFAERHGITAGVIVPSVVRQLLSIAGDKPLLPGLEVLFCTGAPLYPEEKQRAGRVLTPNFCERYGTAETLAISVLQPEDFAERSDSVGQPHSLAEIGIVDDDDRPLPNGQVGQLRFRGPGLGSPLGDDAAQAQFRDGWYYPGEIALLDEDGYIFLQGRTSDVIMRSGAKIYPAEVERTLAEHPAVLEAAVLGHRGPDNEEVVTAFVVLRGQQSAGGLLAHCRLRLTPHKVPRHFHVVEALPKNTAGKVDKLALARSLE